jgi:hypothetical protein
MAAILDRTFCDALEHLRTLDAGEALAVMSRLSAMLNAVANFQGSEPVIPRSRPWGRAVRGRSR